MNVAIGIDNGVSGAIAVIVDNNIHYMPTPKFSQQNYTKKKGNISRIDFSKLYEFLRPYSLKQDQNSVMCLIERPMVNPGRFQATISALRALECTLNVVELLNIPYAYIDSKEWQKKFLPQGVKGDDTKKYSVDIGKRFFPHFTKEIEKQKDADAFLIAKYCQMKYFTNLK
jgi:hypothetical protein